ncbi:MAG: hypothetical protein VX768_06030 [Planctomycetota bacterium]|nr:hypothetical protein [Planctomycetota bacterium]
MDQHMQRKLETAAGEFTLDSLFFHRVKDIILNDPVENGNDSSCQQVNFQCHKNNF